MSRVSEMAKTSRIPEDEWQEISQDIPKFEDPFIQQYVKGQQALIAEEKSQRSGTIDEVLSYLMTLLITQI